MPGTTRPPRALDGILVADFSRVLAGPLASMFLADLGATVVKIERPGTGDDSRTWGPPWVGSTSTYYTSANRNKRSAILDLDNPADLALAQELARRADVVIENFRPGRLAAFGLDAAAVLPANPRAVYCSVSGFGRGEGAHIAGYDFVAQAAGGLMSITGQLGGAPTKAGVALVDVLAGTHATIAILAALRHRDAAGEGQHVEVNLLSSLLASLVNQASGYLNGGPVPHPMGNQHPSVAPYETLATADVPIAVAAANDTLFLTFARTLGHPEIAADARFSTNSARVANRGALITALEAILVAAPVAVWTQRLQGAGVPCSPVNDLPAAFALATDLGLEPTVTFDETADDVPVITTTSPLRLHRTPVRYDRPPPLHGQDTDEVKAWLAGPAVPLTG